MLIQPIISGSLNKLLFESFPKLKVLSEMAKALPKAKNSCYSSGNGVFAVMIIHILELERCNNV